MARFAQLHPENAWANYYYAVSLRKRSADPQAFLEKIVRLDPQFAAAWLDLGIVHAERNEDGRAIAAWQNAVAAEPQMEAAHYRLAQAYRRIGEPAKAKQETVNPPGSSGLFLHGAKRSIPRTR